MNDLNEAVFELILDKGPSTGAEIMEHLNEDGLILWRTCKTSINLAIRTVGSRYLRLDRRVEGFARLSPSILREFLTYSVVGLREDMSSLSARAGKILLKIEAISRAKSELAFHMVSSLGNRLSNEIPINEQACFIIAGDIVYNMAHEVPRPERSTGKMVRGSDMDLVVIVDDDFSAKATERLDDAIFQEKYRLLITPHIREEIDYVVKNLERIREQMQFDTFKRMVASKILQEGTLLYGSERLFQAAKSMLKTYGVLEELANMEKRATDFRKNAEEYLLRVDPDKIRRESMNLFYPTEESEEFE